MIQVPMRAVVAPRSGGSFVERIGEPDAAARIDYDVVRDVQSLPLKIVGRYRYNAIRLVADNAPIVLGGSALAGVQPSLRVQRHAVGVAGILPPDRDLVRRQIVAHDAALLDPCKQQAGAIPDRALGDLAVGWVQDFERPIFHLKYLTHASDDQASYPAICSARI